MIDLPNVTIICVACTRIPQSVDALYKCLNKVNAKAVLITDKDLKLADIETHKIEKLDWKGYNNFIVKELYKYFTTSHCLVIQWDGYILDEAQWTDDFLNYDYIGAKWLYTDGRNVGNGGFSLRSRHLQEILTGSEYEITCPEDEIIGRLYRHTLEADGIKFAPEEVADKFSFELNEPTAPTFGFHGFHHEKYKPRILIERSHALGDVITLEPLLHYYHLQGYKVGLKSKYAEIFKNHYFPIHENLTNAEVINLDKAYEITPKQLHLQSYYEMAGVQGEIRNPKLTFKINEDNKLFKRYCVIHIDERDEDYRNIRGIDWQLIEGVLQEKGYDVIQVGNGKHEKCGIEMKTQTLGMLMYVVAGADLFIGADSGVSHIASAFDIPSIIFFGSVNPKYIYANLDNKIIINEQVCEKPFCWHDTRGETGTPCYLGDSPCTIYETETLINAIEEADGRKN
jgi:hypothetical protein